VKIIRTLVISLFALCILSGASDARPARPSLTVEAKALLAAPPVEGLLLLPDDDMLVPLGGKAKPATFLQPAPKRLEIVRVAPGEALLVVDGALVKLAGAVLHTVAPADIGMDPAVSADASVIVGIEDKRTIKVTTATGSVRVPYRRDGQWELERPWLSADGARALMTVHDFGGTLDAYDLILVDIAKREVEELHLSRTFVPGPLRQTLDDGRVLFRMFTQKNSDDGRVSLDATDFAAFDLTTRKMGTPPPGVLPGIAAPDGSASLIAGPFHTSDDKHCGADATWLHLQAGRPRHVVGPTGPLAFVDFANSPTGTLVAWQLDVKTCKGRMLLVPGDAVENTARWKPLGYAPKSPIVHGRVLR
jgi:hypothetical protein